MSGLKTIPALMALVLSAPPALALPGTESTPTMIFADCTGRLSAFMEHQWIVDPPASDLTRSQRSRMIELLEATMLPEDGRRVLTRRIEAKMAQAQLLTRARYDAHPKQAAQAQALAERELSACLSLLLP